MYTVVTSPTTQYAQLSLYRVEGKHTDHCRTEIDTVHSSRNLQIQSRLFRNSGPVPPCTRHRFRFEDATVPLAWHDSFRKFTNVQNLYQRVILRFFCGCCRTLVNNAAASRNDQVVRYFCVNAVKRS